jgi:hypothetical protein
MSRTPKITTRTLGGGWFAAEVDGKPLIGDRGGISRFQSRGDARKAAQHRISEDKHMANYMYGKEININEEQEVEQAMKVSGFMLGRLEFDTTTDEAEFQAPVVEGLESE